MSTAVDAASRPCPAIWRRAAAVALCALVASLTGAAVPSGAPAANPARQVEVIVQLQPHGARHGPRPPPRRGTPAASAVSAWSTASPRDARRRGNDARAAARHSRRHAECPGRAAAAAST